MPCDATSSTFAYQANLNISRMKQSNKILQKQYFIISNDLQHAMIKCLGQISVHKHFNDSWLIFNNLWLFYFKESGVPVFKILVNISATELSLTWVKPVHPNGIITGYNISWVMTENDTQHAVDGALPKKFIAGRNANSYNISGLGKVFSFCH